MNLIPFIASIQTLCRDYRISSGGLLVTIQAYQSAEPIGLHEIVTGPRHCWSNALGRDFDPSLFRFIEISSGRRPYVLMTLSRKGRMKLDKIYNLLQETSHD